MRPAFVSALLLVAGCASDAEPPRVRNVLLITVDTLRADRLGVYGYERDTSPAIDALAAQSVVFDRAYAQSSWTLPSLASLMTGVLPGTHRCLRDTTSLSPTFDTLAERFDAAGFTTGAVVSHFYLGPKYGLHQGFAHYDDELVFSIQEGRAAHEAITSDEITSRGRDFLDARAQDESAWLLWLHYFDPHFVYKQHQGVSFGSELPDLYDGEVAFTDRHVGAVLEHLSALGLADETLVVFTADHGEELFERGTVGHRRTLYEEVLHIPLIMRLPGGRPRRVSTPVSQVDIAPTILGLAGLEPLSEVDGRSLVPALDGLALDHPPVVAQLIEDGVNLAAIIDGPWKVISDRIGATSELYHLADDPGELASRATERVGVRRRLERLLHTATIGARERAARWKQAPERVLDEREHAILDGLGYGGDEDE